MKKYIGIAASVMLLAAPLSVVFAEEGQTTPPPHIEGGMKVEYRMGPPPSREGMENQDASGTSEMHGDSRFRFGATTTPFMRGEKEGLMRRFGTTTPPGHMGTSTHPRMRGDERDGADATSTEASSTQHKEGRPKINHPSFFDWLFGHSSTTTIGDIRAEIEASTTLSASGTPPHIEDRGFVKHFFSFFGFGSK